MVQILELFNGYGTASFALKRLGVPYELIGYSDIDKYANQCFKQNHCPEDIEDKLRMGDCTKIDPSKLKDFDLLTGGFPCQSFSVAGKGLGELDPRGTLFWEIVRIAEVKKPRYMLLENVKGLVSKKHKPTFDKILSELERIGYHVHWKVLNTKDYGIPQNRERVWFVCFKDKSEYDSFTWPEKEELKIFIKDILEPEPVNSKFYLKEHQIQKVLDAIKKKFNGKVYNCMSPYGGFKSNETSGCLGAGCGVRNSKTEQIVSIDKITYNGHQSGEVYNSEGVCGCINSTDYKNAKGIYSVDWDLNKDGLSSQQNRAYSVDGESPTLGTNGSPKIFALRSYPRTGNDDKDRFQNHEFREDGCSNTLTAVEKDNMVLITSIQEHNSVITNGVAGTLPSAMGLGGGHVPMIGKTNEVSNTLTTELAHSTGRDFFRSGQGERIFNSCGIFRRLTPKECFRLQGFLNDEINLDGLSDTQCYKLAGNGQSVNVVAKIFERMLKHTQK